jgi:hypothetical protein
VGSQIGGDAIHLSLDAGQTTLDAYIHPGHTFG